MMNHNLRKIAHTVSVKCSRGRNERHLAFFLLFFFGVFLGSNASSRVFAELFSYTSISKVALDFSIIASLLFFSTSFLGFILIPFVVAVRGFIFSAMLSSIWFTASGGFFDAFIIEVIPAIFFLPCFFIIASDSTDHSFVLLRYRTNHTVFERSPFAKHILYCIPLLLFELLYCVYLLPLLI